MVLFAAHMIKKHAKHIKPNELLEKVMNAGTSWHHHCLSPRCYVNDTGQEIVLLEAGNDMFYCGSTAELREQLEEHAYQISKPKRKSAQPIAHEALNIVRGYHRQGVKWHFHIAMPRCFLSMQDQYLLIIENDDTSAKHEWTFAQHPVELVRAIDDYYLGRKR